MATKPPDHNRMIGRAAKTHLGPLGMTRKGRSRVWLDDHRWWLGIVEFQPSSWSKTTRLNVAGQFLWIPRDHLAYEVVLRHRTSNRPAAFDPEHPDEFEQYAESVAAIAAESVIELRSQFGSDDSLLERLSQEADQNTDARYRRAIALGLLGDLVQARSVLDDLATVTLTAYQERPEMQPHSDYMKSEAADMRSLSAACAKQSQFRKVLSRRIQFTRAALGLPDQSDLW